MQTPLKVGGTRPKKRRVYVHFLSPLRLSADSRFFSLCPVESEHGYVSSVIYIIFDTVLEDIVLVNDVTMPEQLRTAANGLK